MTAECTRVGERIWQKSWATLRRIEGTEGWNDGSDLLDPLKKINQVCNLGISCELFKIISCTLQKLPICEEGSFLAFCVDRCHRALRRGPRPCSDQNLCSHSLASQQRTPCCWTCENWGFCVPLPPFFFFFFFNEHWLCLNDQGNHFGITASGFSRSIVQIWLIL